jgi:hypothetical protein
LGRRAQHDHCEAALAQGGSPFLGRDDWRFPNKVRFGGIQ